MNEHDLSRRGLLTLVGEAAVAVTQGQLGAYEATRSTAKLFTTEVGMGEDVMLLHGWSCDSHDWSWQLPLFESKYGVVAADLRGHCRSHVMPSGAYTAADLAFTGGSPFISCCHLPLLIPIDGL